MTIAVLAGGGSRRMGRDKAALIFEGETLLERTVRVVSGIGDRTIVVGRSTPDEWQHREVLFVADDYAGLGPLGGLATALRHSESAVLLLPCDMPLLTTEAVRWLVDIASDPSFKHGLIPINQNRIEPLFSIYSQSVLPLVHEHLDRKVHAMRDLIAAGSFEFVPLPAEYSSALRNVNRPEEFDAL